MSATTIPPVLTLSGLTTATVDISQEARDHRNALLALTADVTTVTTAEEARIAAEVLKNVKAFTRTIEETRKIVKEPVLAIGRKVDDVAKEMTVKLDAEATRISRALGDYQAEEQRKAAEARRKAAEEEQRIKDEAAQKLADAAQSSRSEAAYEKKAEKIETAAFNQIAEVKAGLTTAAPIAGTSTRREVAFEVTDIEALYEAAPAFVILTVNTAALKAALKALPEGKSLPGVRHWYEVKAIVR